MDSNIIGSNATDGRLGLSPDHDDFCHYIFTLILNLIYFIYRKNERLKLKTLEDMEYSNKETEIRGEGL